VLLRAWGAYRRPGLVPFHAMVVLIGSEGKSDSEWRGVGGPSRPMCERAAPAEGPLRARARYVMAGHVVAIEPPTVHVVTDPGVRGEPRHHHA